MTNTLRYPLSWVSLFHSERPFPLFGPNLSRMLTVLALELFGHPQERAVDGGAVVVGEIDDAGFDDETAEFDQMPRALAAFDLPCAHIMPRSCGLMAVARRPIAIECCSCRGQTPFEVA